MKKMVLGELLLMSLIITTLEDQLATEYQTRKKTLLLLLTCKTHLFVKMFEAINISNFYNSNAREKGFMRLLVTCNYLFS